MFRYYVFFPASSSKIISYLFIINLFGLIPRRSSPQSLCYQIDPFLLSFCLLRCAFTSILFCFVLLYIAHGSYVEFFHFITTSLIIFCTLIQVWITVTLIWILSIHILRHFSLFSMPQFVIFSPLITLTSNFAKFLTTSVKILIHLTSPVCHDCHIHIIIASQSKIFYSSVALFISAVFSVRFSSISLLHLIINRHGFHISFVFSLWLVFHPSAQLVHRSEFLVLYFARSFFIYLHYFIELYFLLEIGLVLRNLASIFILSFNLFSFHVTLMSAYQNPFQLHFILYLYENHPHNYRN